MSGFVTGYTSIFMTFLYVAIGAGLFKPVISATIAKTTTKETASLGFGIFYMIVNVGAFIDPVAGRIIKRQSPLGGYYSDVQALEVYKSDSVRLNGIIDNINPDSIKKTTLIKPTLKHC